MPLIKLGPLALSSFGVTLVLALWYGSWLVDRMLVRRGVRGALPSTLMLLVLVAGFLGARLWYALFNLDLYTQQPRLVWQISLSGLAFPGALIGSGLALLGWAWYRYEPVARWSDPIAIVLPWGQALGMLGLLLSGEAYGRPSNLPWAVSLLGVERHPSQIYEAAVLLALGIWLWYLFRRQSTPGILTSAYLIGYGAMRLILELFRGDTLLLPGGLRAAQIFGLALVITGLYWCWWRIPEMHKDLSEQQAALSERIGV